MRITVAGAGMAGLVAAARLRQLGHEPRVFEKGTRPGGSMLLSSCVVWRHLEWERFRAEWAPPLGALLDEMRTGPPAHRYIALNQRFHTTLYAHSGCPRLVEMIAALRDASSAYLHIYRAAEDFPVERLDAEHREILAACAARDPERAARATRDHLRHTVEHVAERL